MLQRNAFLSLLLICVLGACLTACDDDAQPQDDADIPLDTVDDQLVPELTDTVELPPEVDGLDTDLAELPETLDVVQDTGQDQAELPQDLSELSPICSEGEKRCSTTGDAETCMANLWVTVEQCHHGCVAGVCLEPTEQGSCGAPLPLLLDTPVEGSTVGGLSSHIWAQGCTNKYGYTPRGPETIYALEVPQLSFIDLRLTPVDPSYYGIYLRGSCSNPESEYHRVCSGNDTTANDTTVRALLGPGTHYVFVDDFAADGPGPGRFTLLATNTVTPTCHGQVPQLLDLSPGSAAVQGNTANGQSNTRGNEYACPDGATVGLGNELIYAFHLTAPSRVRARVTPTDPSDSKVSVYIRSECETRLSAQVACGYTEGDGPAIAEATLPAGEYYLFVDDFAPSTDTTQVFLLQLEVL